MTTDFIEVIDNALPAELCHNIIETFQKSTNLTQGRTGSGVDLDMKNSLDVSLNRHKEFAPYLQSVASITGHYLMTYFEKYFFALIGPIGLTVAHPLTGEPVKLTAENFDTIAKPNLSKYVDYLFRFGEINAQHYECNQGGYPYWHSEVYPQQHSTDALHRVLLFMFYLNDVDKGGETEFHYQDKSIQPKRGRMVIAPAYFTHTHRGNVPISNDKYILTSWVLFNDAKKIFFDSKS